MSKTSTIKQKEKTFNSTQGKKVLKKVTKQRSVVFL